MRRAAALAAALLVVLLAVATGAPAAVRVRTDTENRMRFRLSGRFVTVRSLLNDRALWGERVRAECGPGRGGRGLHGIRTWPRRAETVTFRLAEDISRHARFCRLESAPTRVVIASVRFPHR